MQRNWIAVVLGTALAGCGDSIEGPTIEKVVPVSGTLTFQGKPLEYFQVSFQPTDGRRAALGVTDANGKFTLGTNDVGDGAPPGSHKVAVVWVGPQGDVAAGQEVIIDDPSLLPKPSVQIPARYANPETSQLSQEVPSGGVTDLKIDLK
jgi:hypothetical protein